MKKSVLVLLFLFGLTTQSIFATDGYFRNGYGIKYSALAGSGVAVSLSSLGAVTNPAGITFLNTSYEVNVSFFGPLRDYTVTGNPSGFQGTFGLMPGKVESESNLFFFPGLGGNWKVAENMAVAVSLYANGGMNTDYPAMTFGDQNSASTGVNLEQFFGAATYAYEFVPNHSVGASFVFAFQRFEAKGLGMFGAMGFSSDPNNLTSNGKSTSTGFGFKVGYQGQFADFLRFGAVYQSKMNMSEFKEYAGLFAEGGDFDIPASWTVGVAITPSCCWTFLADVKQIQYSGVKSINNPLLPNLQTALLGTDNGAGFGWKDILVYKFGLMYKTLKNWTIMAGYSYGENPIPDTEVMFNILAPAVVQNHITFGVTRRIEKCHEVTVSFMYALNNSVTGTNPLEAPGQQTIEIAMKQWQVEVGYSFSLVQ